MSRHPTILPQPAHVAATNAVVGPTLFLFHSSSNSVGPTTALGRKGGGGRNELRARAPGPPDLVPGMVLIVKCRGM
jgi:hypothetical protein